MTSAVRRATGLVLVGVVLAIACTFLGRWQWHRHEWRDAQIAIATANYDASTRPLVTTVPVDAPALLDDLEWHPVSVTGRYLPGSTVLLRNRPVDGSAAYHVLELFEVTQDLPLPDATQPPRLLVVDRGWVPTGTDASERVDVPAPPTGEVTLVGRLRPAEQPSRQDAGAGWAGAIDPAQVIAAAGVEGRSSYAPVYLQRVAESPAPAASPGALPAPDLDPGSHLSYAFQWWAFAVGALVGFAWLARRELVEEAEEGAGPDGPAQPDRRPDRPRRREGRAEAEEDALIDSQSLDARLSPPGGSRNGV